MNRGRRMSANASAGTCTLSVSGAVREVVVGTKCKVAYEFDTSITSTGLAIPYAVALNGKILPKYQEGPGLLTKQKRRIDLIVDPGTRCELYLNSDVHPEHRSSPVYAVQVGNCDVLVKITERLGRFSRPATALRGPFCRPGPMPGRPLDVYETDLTGDIWMEISHLYSVTEADALLPSDTEHVIRDAIKRIYSGLTEPKLTLDFAASNSYTAQLTLRFMDEMQDNVRQNTTHCSWLTGLLPRTHPLAFAALLTAARTAGITEVHVTSSWRPCMGSIAHRAGLGLDINYVESCDDRVLINRRYQGRGVKGIDPQGADTDAEPGAVKTLREALAASALVKQVFEPWYMDSDTRDRIPAQPNKLTSANEKLHHNHLHITALEPKILP